MEPREWPEDECWVSIVAGNGWYPLRIVAETREGMLAQEQKYLSQQWLSSLAPNVPPYPVHRLHIRLKPAKDT